LNALNYSFGFTDGSLEVTNVPFSILSLSGVDTNNTVLTWNAISNATYRVQYSDGFDTTNWFDMPPDITATGSVATATDTALAPTQRFYRVQLIP
jgi:hypothetical protein